MKTTIAAALLLLSASALADGKRCYELSADGKSWSKTAETLCVTDEADKRVTVTLAVGMPTPSEVAVFHLDLLQRVRCMDCNKDEQIAQPRAIRPIITAARVAPKAAGSPPP